MPRISNIISPELFETLRQRAEEGQPADPDLEVIEASDDEVLEADSAQSPVEEAASGFGSTVRDASHGIHNLAQTLLHKLDTDGNGIADSVEAEEVETAEAEAETTSEDDPYDTAGEP